MQNDQSYAHTWLQNLIGWIIALWDLMSKIFAGCYLTSAVVEFNGLADDCALMEAFRRLRADCIDDSDNPDRLRGLDEYRVLGDLLRRWIWSRADANDIWRYVSIYVFEAAGLIEKKRYSEAYCLFEERTRALQYAVLASRHMT